MVGRDHADRAARLTVIVIIRFPHVRAKLPFADQDGAEGKGIRHAHGQVFFGCVCVA